MTIQRIYIHLIDGTDVWVLINARQIQEAQFEILENNEYNESDTNELFEFFPGDVVELGEAILSDGTKRQVAKKLISKGQWPDRKFNEFKYKAALKQLNIDQQTALSFREEIERVKTEYSTGQIFYPTIIETVNKLNSLIK
jgi:hypothetical protein